MKYTELSIKSLESECEKWAYMIREEFQPDLLIYVAKAGYLVMRPMIKIFDVPIVGIDATRKGNGLKSIIGPIVSKMPKRVRNFLISMELKSGVHDKNTERSVKFHTAVKEIDKAKIRKILVVDDSVDTGHSMKVVVDAVKRSFPDAEIKSAGLNVWDKSEKIFKTDFALYKNVIIKAPMSKDSREYRQFVEIYKKETQDGHL